MHDCDKADHPPLKRRRVGGLPSVRTNELHDDSCPLAFQESNSVVEQAEKYRLGTVRLPIDSFSYDWDPSAGKNRSVNRAHVDALATLFLRGGLRRKSPENHLRVACRKSDLENMLHALTGQSQMAAVPNARQELVEAMQHRAPTTDQDEVLEWPLFDGWEAINGKAELMDGQHRVEALKLYVQKTGATNQGWWPCALYDRDAMPSNLNIKLRANRRDATLPDGHGQIWQELHRLSEAGTLFSGNTTFLRQEMLDELGLRGRARFPIRRLATLWRNNNWRDMINRWCETRVGRETFIISSWDEMMRCRVDEYWFDKFNNILGILDRLGSGSADRILLDDWMTLSKLPRPRCQSDVLDLFYPLLSTSSILGSRAVRRPGFLEALSKEDYNLAHGFVADSPEVIFEDLSQFVKVKKYEGKMICLIMTHVSCWLNYKPPARVNENTNNKPPLRHEFVLALRQKYGHAAAEEALCLQDDIIRFVVQRGDEFNNPAIGQFLKEFPDEHGFSYTERFKADVWRDLLVVVRERVGPNLKNKCMTPFNTQDPAGIVSEPVSAITQVMCNAIAILPEVKENVALNNEHAFDELLVRIEPVVMRWAIEQSNATLRIQSSKRLGNWSASQLNFVREEQSKFSHILAKLVPLSDTIGDGIMAQVSPGVMRGVEITYPTALEKLSTRAVGSGSAGQGEQGNCRSEPARLSDIRGGDDGSVEIYDSETGNQDVSNRASPELAPLRQLALPPRNRIAQGTDSEWRLEQLPPKKGRRRQSPVPSLTARYEQEDDIYSFVLSDDEGSFSPTEPAPRAVRGAPQLASVGRPAQRNTRKGGDLRKGKVSIRPTARR